jgi:hypothetical protein
MRPRQIRHATVAMREVFEDAPPRGVGQRRRSLCRFRNSAPGRDRELAEAGLGAIPAVPRLRLSGSVESTPMRLGTSGGKRLGGRI